MDNLIYILFICIFAPLLLMLFLVDKKSRILVGYFLIGVSVALLISEFNAILLEVFNGDKLYVTTTITPITEEIIKAIPVLYYAAVFSDDRYKVIPLAFATGIGFGMFENIVILVQNINSVTIVWAVVRGFSTALMHGLCTVTVGIGICYIRKRRKLFISGTFALLVLAILYHGIFNMLVQSTYKYLGFVLPALTYIPILIQHLKRLKGVSRIDPDPPTEQNIKDYSI